MKDAKRDAAFLMRIAQEFSYAAIDILIDGRIAGGKLSFPSNSNVPKAVSLVLRDWGAFDHVEEQT